MSTCPSCHTAIDVSRRLTGELTLCHCGVWLLVLHSLGRTVLTPTRPPLKF